METPPPPEELLKKIQVLEEGQEHLKVEMSKLRNNSDAKSEQHPRAHSVSPQRSRFSSLPKRRVAGGGAGAGAGADAVGWKRGSTSFRHSSPLQRESRSHDPPTGGSGRAGDDFRGGGGSGPSAVNFTDRQYLNILQSIGQSVHIFDPHGRIIYWNKTAEAMYGYSAAEALGRERRGGERVILGISHACGSHFC